MADIDYSCNPQCLPCENTAQISNSELSWRTAVLDLLCEITGGHDGANGCDPMCLPCENTATISNSEMSFRTTVLNLLCKWANG